VPRHLSFLLKIKITILVNCKAAIVESNEINSMSIFYISLFLSLSPPLSLTGEEGMHTSTDI
jgi:hypothetical protein